MFLIDIEHVFPINTYRRSMYKTYILLQSWPLSYDIELCEMWSFAYLKWNGETRKGYTCVCVEVRVARPMYAVTPYFQDLLEHFWQTNALSMPFFHSAYSESSVW